MPLSFVILKKAFILNRRNKKNMKLRKWLGKKITLKKLKHLIFVYHRHRGPQDGAHLGGQQEGWGGQQGGAGQQGGGRQGIGQGAEQGGQHGIQGMHGKQAGGQGGGQGSHLGATHPASHPFRRTVYRLVHLSKVIPKLTSSQQPERLVGRQQLMFTAIRVDIAASEDKVNFENP